VRRFGLQEARDPQYRELRGNRGRDGRLQEGERAYVTETAAMLRAGVLMGLIREGLRLRRNYGTKKQE